MVAANRVIMYYQTQRQSDQYISPLPLMGYITHLILAAFHLNLGNVGADIVHLNNYIPADPYYAQLWPDIAEMQSNGTKVIGMLGGAAPGTYDCLVDELFDTYYPPLRDVITNYNLDGIDLDVEETVSPETMERIINTMKQDFGDDFIITLAPAATALTGGLNLSGFSYIELEAKLGDKIDWYNAQFYSGFGALFPEDKYIDIINYPNRIDPSRVSALVLTNPLNGSGFVSLEKVVSSIENLMEIYGTGWGGIGGWEYFNSLPDSDKPSVWAGRIKDAMRFQSEKMEREGTTEGTEALSKRSRAFRIS